MMYGSYHLLQKCVEFFNLPVNERVEKVKSWRLCSNCLRSGHAYTGCT